MNSVVKRVLLVSVALLLLVYIGFQGYMVLSSPMQTETIERATTYQTLQATGVVFRDETVLTETSAGYLFYTVENGGRVAKNGTIADVYKAESDALAQQELNRLDAEIQSLTTINAQGTTNRAGLAAINRQIDNTWLAITAAAQSTSFSTLDDLHARLLTLLNKKQITIGRVENFDAQLAQLNTKRAQLAKSFQPSTGKVTSPVAGYFISTLDGYEAFCTTKNVTEMSVAEVQKAVAYRPNAIPSGIGKVVGNYEWYLACEITMEQAADLKVGAQMEVEIPLVQSEVIPMTIAAVNKDGNGKAALILQCTRMGEALSALRREQIYIRLQRYDGIRIPDKAIYFNDRQEPGVYVQDGNVLAFRRIQVLHHDTVNHYAVCEMTDDKQYAQLYDKLVVKGEDLYDGKPVR